MAYGTWLWITRWTTDPDFRLLEEQIGYYYEIRWLYERGQSFRPESFASAISGYTKISFEDALAWVHDVLAGRWTPPSS